MNICHITKSWGLPGILNESMYAEPHQNFHNETELVWKISTSPPDIQYMPLNEDSFSDVLAEVIDD